MRWVPAHDPDGIFEDVLTNAAEKVAADGFWVGEYSFAFVFQKVHELIQCLITYILPVYISLCFVCAFSSKLSDQQFTIPQVATSIPLLAF